MTEQGAPAEGQALAAGELGIAHHGWLLSWDRDPDPRSPFPGPVRRTITLIGVRRWTYEGIDRVGLLADESGPFRGTEYPLRADKQVRLERRIRRGIPRARKGDYSSGLEGSDD